MELRPPARAGFALDDIAPEGVEIIVRKAANLHLGGTIHDVTDIVHPVLVDAAITAARAFDGEAVALDEQNQRVVRTAKGVKNTTTIPSLLGAPLAFFLHFLLSPRRP